MSRARAELATRTLITHSPAIVATRVEENIRITNTDRDQVPFDILQQTIDCMVWHHSFRRSELF